MYNSDILRAAIQATTIDEIAANSFSNFHVRGFDYVCVSRSPDCTMKLYFFDDIDPEQLSEVVFPHNHRYDFVTTVLQGTLTDLEYSIENIGGIPTHHAFEYLTPLNGGNGFTYKCEVGLKQRKTHEVHEGQSLTHRWYDIHTIKVTPGTVLRLIQFEDKQPIDEPSFLFSRDNTPPSLDGLYDQMSRDTVVKRLKQIDALT